MLDRAPCVDTPSISAVAAQASAVMPIICRRLVYERGGRLLINAIDLDIAPGSLTVVMGPNGSGKSLLLRLLHGLIEPDTGHILWGNRRDAAAARERQAMVFQRPVLLRRSVGDNIGFVLKLRGEDTRSQREAMLTRVGLQELIKQPARRLSGGEQQRLALARALATRPDVLFLDEPTASHDPASTHMIEEAVVAAHRSGTKIVFITHDIGQARRLADDVIFLNGGRVCEHTEVGRFFSDPRTNCARGFLDGRILF